MKLVSYVGSGEEGGGGGGLNTPMLKFGTFAFTYLNRPIYLS